MECNMLLLQATSLLCLAVLSLCQVIFEESTTNTPSADNRHDGPKFPETCTASNGKQGVCYEFRSAEFGECSFFPSIDTSDPDVEKLLNANTCTNTGRQIYFCCPSTQQKPPPPLTITLPTEDECKVSLSDNVVGGEITHEGDWPWLAAIGMENVTGFHQFCGGTLITQQHVLTAAHCFNTRFEKTIVRLGEYDLNNDFDGALEFEIVGERMGNYSRWTSEDDIMILKLDRPLPPFTDVLRAACLPYHLLDTDFTGKTLTVVGWGIFRYVDEHGDGKLYGDLSSIPLKAQLPAVSSQECQKIYEHSQKKVDDRQLCAGIGGGVDSCGGDSGGPIHYLDIDTGRIYVVGLVSFGPSYCGNSTNPGVYTRIGAFMDWIDESIRLLQ